MAKLTAVEPGFYRIPLPEVLTDSTHGEMRAFELNTVRLRDTDGAEGVGYTFTVGRNGGGIHAVLTPELPEIMAGGRADGAGPLRLRHGVMGPQGAPRRAAALEFFGRLRSEGPGLRRGHRPRPA